MMNLTTEMKDKKALLFVLVSLLLAKFVLVPIVEWQEQKRQEIDKLLAMKAKYISLINDRDILRKQNEQYKDQVKAFYAISFMGKNQTELQISLQSKVNKLVASNAIKVEQSQWLEPEILAPEVAERMLLKVRLSGAQFDFIRLFNALSKDSSLIGIREFNIYIQGQKVGTSLGFAKADMTFYFIKGNR